MMRESPESHQGQQQSRNVEELAYYHFNHLLIKLNKQENVDGLCRGPLHTCCCMALTARI
jgi:hypothetical protein